MDGNNINRCLNDLKLTIEIGSFDKNDLRIVFHNSSGKKKQEIYLDSE